MGKKLTLQGFIDRSISIHGLKYNYDDVEYINMNTRINISCPLHGIFSILPRTHIKDKNGCPRCSSDKRAATVDSNRLSWEDVHQRAFSIHGNTYDYSLARDVYANLSTPVPIICRVHGKFMQSMKDHIHKKSTCSKCSYVIRSERRKDTLSEFISKATKVHGDLYAYDAGITISTEYMSIYCKKHMSYFKQTPANHLQGHGCPLCAKGSNTSSFEIMVEEYIRSIYDGCVETNNRLIIKPKEIDIYLPDINVAIECNGNRWHSTEYGKDSTYHLNKTDGCEGKDIHLIHIFEDEWKFKQKIVKSRLKHTISTNMRKLPARKCTIKQISNNTKNAFLSKYHLQGKDQSSVKYGLFYRDRMVSVMTFCKSKYTKKYEWELSRYATISNFVILGGAGKLLKRLEREYNPRSIVTFADRRWSMGGLYYHLGFTHIHNSKPNYFYVLRDRIQ